MSFAAPPRQSRLGSGFRPRACSLGAGGQIGSLPNKGPGDVCTRTPRSTGPRGAGVSPRVTREEDLLPRRSLYHVRASLNTCVVISSFPRDAHHAL